MAEGKAKVCFGHHGEDGCDGNGRSYVKCGADEEWHECICVMKFLDKLFGGKCQINRRTAKENLSNMFTSMTVADLGNLEKNGYLTEVNYDKQRSAEEAHDAYVHYKRLAYSR